VAVTVSHVSVVDRMVSKEYVQTARPYDKDLASPGAWIETGFSSRGPRWVTVAAILRARDRHWNILSGSVLNGKKVCARSRRSLYAVARCCRIGASVPAQRLSIASCNGTNLPAWITNREVPRTGGLIEGGRR
jgi:hypothetical protein